MTGLRHFAPNQHTQRQYSRIPSCSWKLSASCGALAYAQTHRECLAPRILSNKCPIQQKPMLSWRGAQVFLLFAVNRFKNSRIRRVSWVYGAPLRRVRALPGTPRYELDRRTGRPRCTKVRLRGSHFGEHDRTRCLPEFLVYCANTRFAPCFSSNPPRRCGARGVSVCPRALRCAWGAQKRRKVRFFCARPVNTPEKYNSVPTRSRIFSCLFSALPSSDERDGDVCTASRAQAHSRHKAASARLPLHLVSATDACENIAHGARRARLSTLSRAYLATEISAEPSVDS